MPVPDPQADADAVQRGGAAKNWIEVQEPNVEKVDLFDKLRAEEELEDEDAYVPRKRGINAVGDKAYDLVGVSLKIMNSSLHLQIMSSWISLTFWTLFRLRKATCSSSKARMHRG